MNNAGALQVTTPSEREIVMTRAFDAPRNLVFDCWTKPELVRRWLGVFGGWSMTVCEIDLRVGGNYRYVWRGQDGTEMGMGGTYREIVAPERIVATEKFDETWYPGEAIDTVVMLEDGGETMVTTTVLYESREARDGVLKTGMAEGVSAGYDTLAELLASLLAGGVA
ncbi:MAG TPA: SRPBCC family protein [Dehalococcoidia bacterium]|nr:SRPBCC family protein [Dehalococcoidia bacterium]